MFHVDFPATSGNKEGIHMPQFTVTGMRCGGCTGRVQRLIEGLLPEARIDIDLSSGAVSVEHPAIDRDAILRAITEAGFGVSVA